jgi:hypothetical protein
MKNIKSYGTYSLDEADSYRYTGQERWKELFNSEYKDLYDKMISSAKYRRGGIPSPEDLLVILSAFELILETPEEILALYAMLKLENPKLQVSEESLGNPNSPAAKAMNLVEPYMMKLKSNPAYQSSYGGTDLDKLFPQIKLDF